MIHQVAEFIKWKLELDGGNEDELAVIISEANTKTLIDQLSDVSQDMNNIVELRAFALMSVIALDDYLQKEGWYKVMDEDKEQGEVMV